MFLPLPKNDHLPLKCVVSTTRVSPSQCPWDSPAHCRSDSGRSGVSDDRIHYDFTVEDPATRDRPWSAEIPMMATEGPMYEYACHGGNHDLRHILDVYRNIERQDAEWTQ